MYFSTHDLRYTVGVMVLVALLLIRIRSVAGNLTGFANRMVCNLAAYSPTLIACTVAGSYDANLLSALLPVLIFVGLDSM